MKSFHHFKHKLPVISINQYSLKISTVHLWNVFYVATSFIVNQSVAVVHAQNERRPLLLHGSQNNLYLFYIMRIIFINTHTEFVDFVARLM